MSSRTIRLLIALALVPQPAWAQATGWEGLLEAGPNLTVIDRAPVPTNAADVVRAMKDRFSDEITGELDGLESSVWFLIDEEGVLREARLSTGSGNETWDRLALWMSQRLTFEPASRAGIATPAWIQLPVTANVR